MSSKDRIRYQLYRWQQRLGITRREIFALWIIFALIAAGAVVKEYRARTASFDPSIYGTTDSLFAAATAGLLNQSIPADTTRVVRDTLPAPQESVRININTASARELERLPRIGPAMAERIVAYRTRYGPFRRPKDLMRVRGIGPKTFEQMEAMIVVD